MSPILLVGAAGELDIAAQVITTVVTFLLVVLTLKMLAWKPALSAIDERRRQVAEQWAEIDSEKARAEALRKEYEEKLRHIDDERREILNKAVDEGNRLSESLVAKARAEAEEIAEKSRLALELEVDKARLQLRREVVELSLAATGKLLDVTLDDPRHRQLVESFVTDLQKREA
ncbi:MAG: F0F1 ATP synthase subunit B [Candidatus Sumerlaeia bacterium]|nr:F0F1 ATP synthase subunit B [Candidatus Sumerlaeia bacterium]